MRVLKNDGNATILAAVICLGIVMIMCAASEYMNMLIISNGIKSALESAVLSSVVGNYDEAYSQLREGYSGGYVYADTGFSESMDEGNIYARLDELLALREVGDEHIKYVGEKQEYSISNLRTEMQNADLAQGNADKNLNITAFVDVTIPVRFGGRELLPIRYTLKVKASYTPKF